QAASRASPWPDFQPRPFFAIRISSISALPGRISLASQGFNRGRIKFCGIRGGDKEEASVKILAVTNMYPSPERPGSGVFVEQQVKGLLSSGVEVRVLFVDRRKQGTSIYFRIPRMLEHELVDFAPDLVHVMYGGVMADQVTKQRELPPTVVT